MMQAVNPAFWTMMRAVKSGIQKIRVRLRHTPPWFAPSMNIRRSGFSRDNLQIIPEKIAEMISAIYKMIPPIDKIIPTICKMIPTVCKTISAICKMISAIDEIIPTVCKIISAIYKMISAIDKIIPPICKMIPTICKIISAICKMVFASRDRFSGRPGGFYPLKVKLKVFLSFYHTPNLL
jgi:hypothetical protein